MYCTVEEVLGAMKEDLQNNIIGDEYIEDPGERLEKMVKLSEEAIEDAGAEIDGYIAKRYRLPLSKVPPVLNKYAKDIAVYNLVSRMGVDESDREKTFLNRYNAAIKFLLEVAKGTVDLDVEEPGNGIPGEGTAANGFRMSSSSRIFSRDSMKGW